MADKIFYYEEKRFDGVWMPRTADAPPPERTPDGGKVVTRNEVQIPEQWSLYPLAAIHQALHKANPEFHTAD